jgi:hypothetical protein
VSFLIYNIVIRLKVFFESQIVICVVAILAQ